MKNIQKIAFLSLVAAFFLSSNIFAQAEKETEVVIIKKIVDENGVESEEKVIIKGEDAEKYIKEQNIKITESKNAKGEHEMTVEVKAENNNHNQVNVWISDDGEKTEIKEGQKMIFIDSDGKELPADIRKMLEEKGVDIDELINDSSEETKSKYKVIEIDDDGNKKIIEGEGEMPTEVKEMLEENNIELEEGSTNKVMMIEEDIDVQVTEGKKVIKIKKVKNGEESETVYELDDSEQIPAELRDLLIEHDIDLNSMPDKGKVRIEMKDEKQKEIKIEKKKVHTGNPNKAQLGVMIDDDDNGAKVIDLVDGSSAKSAGVKENDIITKVNKTKVQSADELIEALSSMNPGDKVKLTLIRNGELKKVKVTLKAASYNDQSNNFRTEHKILEIKGGDLVTCKPIEKRGC